ncbi:AER341Wp [Eremothecium gossypii ATCC 10895]|uniref:tRNA dimethylallyltransferase n=1 Tax=Eremothecium gossypii (strain ATCC 10895 / CBS 109.51 / FGSC 9923 / NRRL Y-1056) TaxID=284811 RepID=Q756C6_EREGS|nr:AER341Wp [Eremothecium gossypii ATCC 10895]AAS53021.1 AER341Wp [Eremothecium gossypii ATCC 10895]
MLRRLLQRVRMGQSLFQPKVLVIAGTTGVGKSQLAVELALRFNGEVINSDSMQVYCGVPIITNKHPIEERRGVKHHLMDYVGWHEEYYLHRFEQECLQCIDDIHRRGKLPIIVGGTHYYLQALFQKRVKGEGSRAPTAAEQELLNSGDADAVYEALGKVDPDIAAKYHPNDIRRVRRMLEIYYTTGTKPSRTFAAQELQLRYDTLFLWLYSDMDSLGPRLDARVDNMLANGGMAEIRELYGYYRNNTYSEEQCQNGIWQVIGFKEFLPWLENSAMESLETCVDKMKTRTRQYAKKQIKWIRKMLIPDISGKIYLLDASDLSRWDNLVHMKAVKMAASFLENSEEVAHELAPPELQFLLTSPARTSSPKENKDWTHYKCPICRDKNDQELTAIGEHNWLIHTRSRRHKANLNRGKKKKAYEEWAKKKLAEEMIEPSSTPTSLS